MLGRLALRLANFATKPPAVLPKASHQYPKALFVMHTRLLGLGRTGTVQLRAPAAPLARPAPARALCAAAASAPGSGSGGRGSSRASKPARHSSSSGSQPAYKAAKPRAMEAQAPPAKKPRLEGKQGAPAAAALGAAPAGEQEAAQPASAAAEAAAPAEDSEVQQAEQGQQQRKSGKGPRKKKKEFTPEMQARFDLQMAAKAGDIGAALAIYDRMRAEGRRLPPDAYNTLLYLCSLGEDWEASVPTSKAAAEEPAAPSQAANGSAAAAGAAAAMNGAAAAGAEGAAAPAADPSAAAAAAAADGIGPKPSAAEVMDRGHQIFAELVSSSSGGGGGGGVSEMCYTALARMAAVAGDPEGAFQVVKDMRAAGVAPKLRSFTPALAGFAEQGKFDRAAEVDAAIAECALDLTEAEYARLMQAAAASASWEQGRSVLLRIGRELTVLERGTLEHCRAFFAAQAATGEQQQQRQQQQGEAQALPRWEVGDCGVSHKGEVRPAGGGAPLPGRMRPVDLDKPEWETFRDGIAALAERQERRPNDFRRYLDWLGRHGPFGAVVDGANVALFGQNFAEGGFTFDQIRAVREHLLKQHPGLKPLVLLHTGRTKAPEAKAPAAQALLEEMRAAGQFYATPAGSNDDWYWIYAAVAAGEKGLLVSNDEMRDHIFQLLAPKYFLKWKQRHQVKYKFGLTGPQFEYPAPFTTCVQELACGSWVLPAAEGPWLLAQRVPALATAAAGAEAKGAATAAAGAAVQQPAAVAAAEGAAGEAGAAVAAEGAAAQ